MDRFGLVVLGILVAGAVAVLGGFRFPALDLERFLASQGPGWEWPPLFARLRLQLPSGVPSKTDEKLPANQTRHDDALTP